MEKLCCPKCGEKLPFRTTVCTCGEKLRLSDEELSRRVTHYARFVDLWYGIAVLAIIASTVIGVSLHSIQLALTVLFISVTVVAVALRTVGGAQTNLLAEQLNEFFQKEAEALFGPALHTEEMRIDQSRIHASGVIETAWEIAEISFPREGVYRGVHFSAANAKIIHEYEAGGTEEDGSQSRRETVFDGIWLVLLMKKRIDPPVFVRRYADKRSGKPNEKSAASNMKMESEAFNEHFAVWTEDEHNAFYLLTPASMEQLEALCTAAEGRPLIRFSGEEMQIAIDTDRRIMSVEGKPNPKDIETYRSGYRRSLAYLARVLDVMIQNTSWFAADEKPEENNATNEK